MMLRNYEEIAAMVLFGIGFTLLLLNKNMIKKIIPDAAAAGVAEYLAEVDAC